MKYSFVVVLVLSTFFGYSQSSPEKRVRDFLSDLKSKKWTFDQMYKNHMQFELDSFKNNKDIIGANEYVMESIAKQLKEYNLDISKLIIKRYDKAESSVKTMALHYSPELVPLTFIAYDSNKKFVRYFLLNKNHMIHSLIRIKDDTIFVTY